MPTDKTKGSIPLADISYIPSIQPSNPAVNGAPETPPLAPPDPLPAPIPVTPTAVSSQVDLQSHQNSQSSAHVLTPSLGHTAPFEGEPKSTVYGIPTGISNDASEKTIPHVTKKRGMKGILLTVIIGAVFIGLAVYGGLFFMRMLSENSPVTLTYWGLWEPDTIMKGVIEPFEASHPKIKINYIKQSYRQYRQRLTAAIDRGEGPDVFRFHNTWVPMLIKQLASVPATIMTVSQFESTFYPVAKNDLVAGSAIYGLPLMIDGLGLYYNEDLLATAGVSPPSTWEDLLLSIPKLRVVNEGQITTAAIALGTGNNVEHATDILALMMKQNGAKLRDLTGNEAVVAMTFYRKFSNPNDDYYTWNDTLDNSIVSFANGRVAMIFAPSWRAFDIKNMNPNLRFKIAPVPQLPENTVTWASYWVEGVSSKSKHEKAAWEFVHYLTSSEGATKLYTQTANTRLFGEPYARRELGSQLLGDVYAGAYISQAEAAQSFPVASRTFDEGLNDQLGKYLLDAINSIVAGTSAEQALEVAGKGFTQVLTKFGLANNTAR